MWLKKLCKGSKKLWGLTCYKEYLQLRNLIYLWSSFFNILFHMPRWSFTHSSCGKAWLYLLWVISRLNYKKNTAISVWRNWWLIYEWVTRAILLWHIFQHNLAIDILINFFFTYEHSWESNVVIIIWHFMFHRACIKLNLKLASDNTVYWGM